MFFWKVAMEICLVPKLTYFGNLLFLLKNDCTLETPSFNCASVKPLTTTGAPAAIVLLIFSSFVAFVVAILTLVFKVDLALLAA